MPIGLKGLYTPPAPEERDICYLEITHNGINYDWMIFIPKGVDVGAYIASKENDIYADIDAKEQAWAQLEVKTKTVFDLLNDGSIEVPIEKSEIVKPNNPDYYALRRAEYPALADQLDAFWKGIDSPEYIAMQNKIAAVKAKYPKP